MKLIIDIDDQDFKFIKSVVTIKDGSTFKELALRLFTAVKHGCTYDESLSEKKAQEYLNG